MCKEHEQGYLLAELMIVLVLFSLFSVWAFAEWEDVYRHRRLENAARKIEACVHEVQALARGNVGAGSNPPTLVIAGSPRNEYYTIHGVYRINPAGQLPEGISFTSGRVQQFSFQSDGRIMNVDAGDYAINLKDEYGNYKSIIISAQTGRVRIANK